MTVEEKFQRLNSRIEQLTAALRELQGENQSLREESKQLRSELGSLREQCHKLKLDQADRSALVTTKLTTVLQRLDELERLEQG